MSRESLADQLGKDLPAGARHYRAFIGPPERYDLVSATQFNLLTYLGLREDHYLLDIGCGSLRGGRLFVIYLLPNRYFGIEPEQWLIDQGIEHELGHDLVRLKRPTFSNDPDFTLSAFGRTFDFILAQSIFSHASQTQIRRCLAEARQVMGPSSVFVANYGKGETDYSGDAWVYPGGVVYTEALMQAMATEHGLVCRQLSWPHPNGLTWVALTRPEFAPRLLNYTDQLPFLKDELDRCRRRLATIENHPYVRLGMLAKRLIRRVRRA